MRDNLTCGAWTRRDGQCILYYAWSKLMHAHRSGSPQLENISIKSEPA